MRTRSVCVLATLVAVSTTVGLAGAAAASASIPRFTPAATTVCNNSTMPCTNISSLMLNQGNGPDFIQNASGWGVVPPSLYQGRKINLRQASDTRVNEDFIITKVGPLGQLCGASGANSLDPTSYACINFPATYPVYEGQFAPDGNESGFCVGAMSATLGFKIRLERCGSPRSFWIADLAQDVTVTLPGGGKPLVYFPLEFAADPSLSNPLVLTLRTGTKSPANELFLEQENLSGGQVPDSQLFTLTDPVGPTVVPAS